MAYYLGTTGNDTYSGTTDPDTILGGEGDDILFGDAGNDLIRGGPGADDIDGGTGDDRMEGGDGDDIIRVDSILDVVKERDDQGYDTVISSVTFALPGNFEVLQLSGTFAIDGYANGNGNRLIGNSASNQLYGGQGTDELDGGEGADSMTGGAGDDVYWVDVLGDKVFEEGNDGYDTVNSMVSYVLPAHVEALNLLGTANIDGTGNGGANAITGNIGANRLVGGQGNDVLDGAGGADRMEGGRDDDEYHVDDVGDVVVEKEGRGIDTVYSTVSYTLTAHVEGLYLEGGDDIDGIGNGLANLIMGNSGVNYIAGAQGNDILDGQGGADTMYGGDGDDIFFVDDAGDVVIEKEGKGFDGIFATVSYTLAANSEVEGMALLGSDDLDLTGNQRDNSLLGNAGDNVLSGGAGDDNLDGWFGADTLIGGKGDDWFRVDDAGDTVIEVAGEGHDTVFASVDVSIAGTDVEDVVVENPYGVTVIGNGLDNYILGFFGNDVLMGGDGDDQLDGYWGVDLLTGGAGADQFLFTSEFDPDFDLVHILDFAAGEDTIVLDQFIFDAILDTGVLAEEAFGIGTVATTADQRILYDPVFGKLYYDADGSDDFDDPLLFAQVTPGTALTFADFAVFDDTMLPTPPCGCF